MNMPNENTDLDSILAQMSSINSEDYWFKKVSNVEDKEVQQSKEESEKQDS